MAPDNINVAFDEDAINTKSRHKSAFCLATTSLTLDYFFSSAGAAGAAGAAASAGAAGAATSGAGATSSAGFLPQAVKARANRAASRIERDNFIP